MQSNFVLTLEEGPRFLTMLLLGMEVSVEVRSCIVWTFAKKNVCKSKMQSNIERLYVIKFCARLGKSGTTTLGTIQQAYDSERLSQTQAIR